MPVIDFSEFPLPDTEAFIWMPEDEFEQYEIYCEYIQLGTSVPAGTKVESGFYCRREMEDGELCDGTIEVMQIEQPEQIRWECRKCADKGAVVNFKDTVWDNSLLTQTEKEMFLEDFFADISGEDIFEDEFFDLFEDEIYSPFDNFEYFINPYDPDGKQTGGPSSAVIEEMLVSDWNKPEAPIFLRGDLPKPEVEKSYFFYNARQFLLTLKEDETFSLTRTDFLKRKVVRRLLKKTHWPENYIEEITRFKNNPDESDIWLLHGIRVLLDLAGLIDQEADKYRLNENMLHLLDDANAGQLYRLLFSTYYNEMNLGYLGSTFELPHLQYSIPFILFKLRKLAKNWISLEDLLPEILLYSVNLELQFEDLDNTGLAYDLLYHDLFSSLERFALIETRRVTNSPGESFPFPDQVKITPLFEKFIVLNVE